MWLNAKEDENEAGDFKKYLIPNTCCWMQKTRPYQLWDENETGDFRKCLLQYLCLNVRDQTISRWHWYEDMTLENT